MKEDSIYRKIEDMFGALPDNFSILEEEINVELQMEYFDLARRYKHKVNEEHLLQQKDSIFDDDTALEEKKKILVQLASIEEVDAYRTIEKYLQNPDQDLRDWAVLALQENRILLESKLLDEDQVFISTGLGGKENRLRYFVVLIHKQGHELSQTQQKVIKNEFESIFATKNTTIEDLNFGQHYATILMLAPMDVTLKDLIDTAILECNQFGDFLDTKFIITNVKKLSFDEINEFIKEQ